MPARLEVYDRIYQIIEFIVNHFSRSLKNGRPVRKTNTGVKLSKIIKIFHDLSSFLNFANNNQLCQPATPVKVLIFFITNTKLIFPIQEIDPQQTLYARKSFRVSKVK